MLFINKFVFCATDTSSEVQLYYVLGQCIYPGLKQFLCIVMWALVGGDNVLQIRYSC